LYCWDVVWITTLSYFAVILLHTLGMVMKAIALILLVCFSNSAIAEIYKCVQSGETVYSNFPCGKNAQLVPDHITPQDVSSQKIYQETHSVQPPKTEAPPTAVVSDFQARIRSKIRGNIVPPPDLPENTRVEFVITLTPKGYVKKLRLVKSSSHEMYDKSVKSAILKSQPLPIPTDPALFNRFRELDLMFKPRFFNNCTVIFS